MLLGLVYPKQKLCSHSWQKIKAVLCIGLLSTGPLTVINPVFDIHGLIIKKQSSNVSAEKD